MPPLSPRDHILALSDDEYLLMVRVAGAYARRLYADRVRPGTPAWKQPDDFVMDSLARLIVDESTDKWDRAKKDFLGFLMMDVRGDMLHYFDSAEARRAVDPEGVSAERMPKAPGSPEEDTVKRESAAHLSVVLAEIRQHLDPRPPLGMVFEPWLDGRRPREIAISLGIPRQEVYDRIREIKRVLERPFRGRVDFQLLFGDGE